MDESLFNIFPLRINKKVKEYITKEVQEIRIKINKPLILYKSNGESILDLVITKEDFKYILQRISSYSLYAYEEEIKQGFITLKGGHRVGLAGECVMEDGKIKTIRNISSLNIRISREVIGCAHNIMKYIYVDGNIQNTLIISPPKCGKTTILRDIARIISSGNSRLKLDGRKVVVVDERSEIGASYLGVPQMNLGIRTDVLDNCLKKEGMLIAIRSLSPDVLICDEIGTEDDIKALESAFNSGVNIVVTVHGSSLEDIKLRRNFDHLLQNNIIKKIIVLSNKKGVGTIENIYYMDCDKGEYICLN